MNGEDTSEPGNRILDCQAGTRPLAPGLAALCYTAGDNASPLDVKAYPMRTLTFITAGFDYPDAHRETSAPASERPADGYGHRTDPLGQPAPAVLAGLRPAHRAGTVRGS